MTEMEQRPIKNSMNPSVNYKVVCFGEVLWDILPDGAVPGGAPMNVAYHLHKLGNDPALITRIGVDARGKEILSIFSGYGLCTDYFQLDSENETGKVFAKPNEHNEMAYDIVMPVAWDFIQHETQLNRLVQEAEYFVFGSLAARNPVSANTLFSLIEMAKYKVLDINLRPPHYNRRIVEQLLSKADFLKLNLPELELITGWFSHKIPINDRIKSVREKYHIPELVVTLGEKGAILYREDKFFLHGGFKVKVADTVGSGDAFLAGLLSKFLEKKRDEEAIEFACALGAFIATKRGACPSYENIEMKNLIK